MPQPPKSMMTTFLFKTGFGGSVQFPSSPLWMFLKTTALSFSMTILRDETKGHDGDEQAAYSAAAWLQRADRSDSLSGFSSPSLTAEERGIAKIE